MKSLQSLSQLHQQLVVCHRSIKHPHGHRPNNALAPLSHLQKAQGRPAQPLRLLLRLVWPLWLLRLLWHWGRQQLHADVTGQLAY